MTEHFILPDRLDSSAAPGLVAALLDRSGKPLVLDADRVEVIGALALEVIIAGGRQWEADGHSLTIRKPSARFVAACQVLGLDYQAPWQTSASRTAEGMGGK